MKIIPHYSELKYHTWRDVGGPVGFVLNMAFCAVVFIAAFFMVALCTALVVLDYIFSPAVTLISRLRTQH